MNSTHLIIFYNFIWFFMHYRSLETNQNDKLPRQGVRWRKIHKSLPVFKIHIVSEYIRRTIRWKRWYQIYNRFWWRYSSVISIKNSHFFKTFVAHMVLTRCINKLFKKLNFFFKLTVCMLYMLWSQEIIWIRCFIFSWISFIWNLTFLPDLKKFTFLAKNK